jgi:hypothetical protein
MTSQLLKHMAAANSTHSWFRFEGGAKPGFWRVMGLDDFSSRNRGHGPRRLRPIMLAQPAAAVAKPRGLSHLKQIAGVKFLSQNRL